MARQGGVDFEDSRFTDAFSGDYRRLEIDCNRFAGNLLVPSDALDAESPDVSEENITKLASRFSVSRELILRKLSDRGLVTASRYLSLVDQWAAQATGEKSKGRPNFYLKQISYLGKGYVEAAFGKYYSRRINLEELSQYLSVKVKNIGTFESHVFRSN